MKKLYLMRHAKSSWDDPRLEDHERPLTSRGRKAALRMGEHLAEVKVTPEVVLVTSAVRARETVEQLRSSLPPEAEVKVEPRLYSASGADLLRRIKRLSPRAGSVLIVGHNPAIQELTLELAGRGDALERAAKKFPTAAVAVLEARVQRWADLAPGKARLVDFVRPKDLKK